MTQFFSRPWDSQPQEEAEVAPGPIAVVLPNANAAITYATAKHERVGVYKSALLNVRAGAAGMGLGLESMTADCYRLHSVANQTDTVWERPSAGVTLLVYFTRAATVTTAGYLFGNSSAATSPFNAWSARLNGSSVLTFETAAGGTYADLSSGFTVPLNTPTLAICTYDGTTKRIYINGAERASAAATGALAYPSAATRGPALGGIYDAASNRSFPGRIFLAALWDKALSPGEIARLSENPWRLFEPRRIYIPTAATGGGTDATATLPSAPTTSAAGTVSASGSAAASLTGAGATAGAGAVSASPADSGNATLPGAGATSAAGVLVGTGTGVTALTGASAAASAGTLSASASGGGDASVSLTGAAAVVAAGTITVTGTAVVLLSEAGATANAGAMSASNGTTPARKLENWYYRPALVPMNAEAWLVRELNTISRSTYGAAPFVQMVDVTVEPDKPNPGMVVFTTATAWDPGSGAGVYCYRSGAWHLLG